MRKRLLSTLLALCMALTLLPGTALAAVVSSGSCGANVTWSLDDAGILTISGTGTMGNYTATNVPWYSHRDLVKSAHIENGVTSFGSWAFSDCGSLASVTIPRSVISIGDRAFYNCSGLASVTIPGSITSMGEYAFSDCSNLTSVTISDGVTSIGSWAFSGCDSLASVTIPRSVTSIGDHAFYNCSGLTSATISDGVTRIGDSAFYYCDNLTSVTIPGSVTSIESGAFGYCSSLTNVTIPDGVTEIENGAFTYCDSLANVTIPGSVTLMEEYAFSYCGGLTSVTISDGVTRIGEHTFLYCSNLTNVTISDSVTEIVNGAFAHCDRLSDIYYAGTMAQWGQVTIDENNKPLLKATIHCSDGNTSGSGTKPSGTASITQLSPANGSTFNHADTTADTRIRIFFDREVSNAGGNRPELDFSVGTLEIHKADDQFVVYQVQNNTDVSLWNVDGKPTAIVLKNATPVLDYETEYYVTMPAGFIKLADGSKSPAIAKGAWEFKTSGGQAYMYNFEYALDGGSWSEPDVCLLYAKGDTVSISKEKPTKDGYIFNGWSDGSVTYQPGESFAMPECNVTLTAVWEDARVRITLPTKQGYMVQYSCGKLTPTVSRENVKLVWSSSDPSVAEVDQDGNIQANKPGQTIIYVAAEADVLNTVITYQLTVTPSMSIKFRDTALQLKNNGEDATATVNFTYRYPDNSAKPIIEIISSDPSVISVGSVTTDKSGMGKCSVTALKAGLATITASIGYDDVIKTDTLDIYAGLSPDEVAHVFATEARKYVGLNREGIGNKLNLGNGAWCAWFVEACAEKIGATSVVPKEGLAAYLPGKIIKQGGVDIELSESKIQVGDVLTFSPDHSGIVCDVVDGNVYVVHGNWHSRVCAPEGYGITPERGGYGSANCVKHSNYYKACGKWLLNGSNQSAKIVRCTRPDWAAVADNVDRTTQSCGTRDVYHCPIEVSYTYDGETLDSTTGQYTASFGKMEVTGEGADKTITVDIYDDYDVDIEIFGTDSGFMTLMSSFLNEGILTNTLKFENVPVTERLVGKLAVDRRNFSETLFLYDNDDENPKEVWTAIGNETATSSNKTATDWYINGNYADIPDEPGIPNVPGSSNSSGNHSGYSSGSTSGYAISVPSSITGGTVRVTPTRASKGKSVTITATPNSGYELDTLSVKDSKGNSIDLTNGSNGKYTFIMPASKVSVTASFRLAEQPTQNPSTTFSDVPNDYWAKDAIEWAGAHGYMNGKTSSAFDPEGTITRQQVWMILARLSGQSPASMPDARTWAINNGLSDGTNPGAPITRQQMVTLLYRYCSMMNYPIAGSGSLAAFPDFGSASKYAKDALTWAVGNGIITGTKAGTLNPAGTATRAQFAVVLKRFYEYNFSD